MTAESFAELLGGRPAGPGKWRARCPAHGDHNPSLAIRQGDNCVLLKCWSRNCSPAEIAAACKLTMQDLFDRQDVTPERRAASILAREKIHAKHLAERHAAQRLFKLQKLQDVIAAKLASHPDDAELTKLFHEICNRLRDAQNVSKPGDGPMRLEEPTPMRVEMVRTLSELGSNFGA